MRDLRYAATSSGEFKFKNYHVGRKKSNFSITSGKRASEFFKKGDILIVFHDISR